ncbi:MAG: glycosyltransferase [Verrucomicrobiota bacterium]
MTPVQPPSVVLVTPVWNDSARLAVFGAELAEALAAEDLPVRWIIADDGSGAEEVARLEELAENFRAVFPHVFVLPADAHRGKGGVIRAAWDSAPDADWYAFADADGAVCARDLLHLVHMAVGEECSVIAIRKTTAETEIIESPGRSLTHHVFLFAADFLLGLRSADTQCGAKVIKGADFRAIRPSLREDGYVFDAEWLFHLQHRGLPWMEVPVSWTEKPGAKVKPVRDGIRMFIALWRIRRRGGR